MPESGLPSSRRGQARFRRRLRSRIILSFVLLGFGLTALFAFATNWNRTRVEDKLIVDLMSRNIDEYARSYLRDPSNVAAPVQQMYGRVVKRENFEALRQEQPEWYGFQDGLHNITGKNDDGTPFS